MVKIDHDFTYEEVLLSYVLLVGLTDQDLFDAEQFAKLGGRLDIKFTQKMVESLREIYLDAFGKTKEGKKK